MPAATTLKIQTARAKDMVDITAQVKAAVRAAGIDSGLCVVFCPHTTAGIGVNENTDPAVRNVRGMIAQLDAGTYKERQKVTTALLAEGPKALALLNQALPGATLEKRTRLENCIKAIDTPG